VEIEGVDAELRNNVAALLSVERYKGRERIEPDAVERLYRRVDQEVRDALRPFGYYQPKVSSTLETLDRERNWRVRISIETGPPVIVDQVSVMVRGPGAQDPNFTRITAAPPARSGDRLLHPVYERMKTDLQRTANTYGYLDARMLRSELQVDPTARKASMFLEIETGERYHFGPTTIEQDAIREARVRRFLQYREGEPYDATKWLRTQFALDDSLYFATVEVSPGVRDTANHIVPMHISAQPSRRSYPLTIGYGANDGLRGSVGWFDPRVNSLGHRLRLQLRGSSILQSADAAYDVPLRDPAREKVSLAATIAKREPSANVRTQELSLKPSITQVMGRWQRIVSVTAAHTETENLELGPEKLVDDLVVPGIVYASVPEGYLGESLLSRSFYAELVGSHSILGANDNFLRLNLQAERVFDLKPGWHLLVRGELGASAVGQPREVRDELGTSIVVVEQKVPGQYQFFAGGDRSVRGFAYGELSPYDVVASTDSLTSVTTLSKVNRGGRHLITGTLEIERDLPRNFGVAAFVDFGNSFDHFGDPLAYSAGIGFRWRLPGVTLGIDVARPIRAPGFYSGQPAPPSGEPWLERLREARFHLNISPRL
jgi:translocation and assembly module TamA